MFLLDYNVLWINLYDELRADIKKNILMKQINFYIIVKKKMKKF